MVNYLLDATLAALADPTRRAILARLAQGPSSVTRLAEPFDVSLPAISKHLRVLEAAGLLARRKKGRVHHCRLVARPIQEAARWMDFYRRFWDDRLDALADYLTQPGKGENHSWPARKSQRKPRSESGAGSRPRPRRSSAPGRNRNR